MNTRSISLVSLFLCIFISSLSAQVQLGLHVEENMTVLYGKDTTGAGIKAFWLPSKAAFRMGIVGDKQFQGENLISDSTAWDYDSIGILSFASGLASKAKGDYSAAMGELVEANGSWSFAMGTATLASGGASAAIGSNCESQGFASLALGDHTIARGRGAIAVGVWNEPIDDINSTADSIRLFVVGNGTFSQRSNAMVIQKNGQVGIGTNSPFHLLDLGTTNGRKLAIHQNANGNDYYGFGISASTLEFHAGNNEAADPQMVVKKSSGNVGIGTTDPADKLDVNGGVTISRGDATSGLTRTLTIGGSRNSSDNDFARIDFENLDDNSTNSPYIGARISSQNDNSDDDGDLRFFTATDGTLTRGMTVESNGNVGIGDFNPSHPLHMASGAHVTTGGVWTDASSREYKENIQDLTSTDALATRKELEPKQFNYKVDPEETYLGFIAEDVPDLVASQDRTGLTPMDFVAVLTKVVQDQQEIISQQNLKINKLEERVDALGKRKSRKARK